MTKTLTPEQMLGELATACTALTASGVYVLAGNKIGIDLVLSVATARGTRTRESRNERGTVEATSLNTLGRYDRRDGRGRGERGGGNGARDRDRANPDSNWRHGGCGNGHNNCGN